MDSLEPKKLALIRVLQILQKHSDGEHPIKHEKIVELLESEYGLTIERRVEENAAIPADVLAELKENVNNKFGMDKRKLSIYMFIIFNLLFWIAFVNVVIQALVELVILNTKLFSISTNLTALIIIVAFSLPVTLNPELTISVLL